MPLIILCSFFALPVLEIVVFIAASYQLPLLITISITVLTALFGIILLKTNSMSSSNALKGVFEQDSKSLIDVRGKIMQIVSGILLVLPGLISDTIGLILVAVSVKSYLIGKIRMEPKENQVNSARLDYDFNADYKDITKSKANRSTPNKP
jgi:UPF0716 protein FxsA